MKNEDVPQDLKHLNTFTKELIYATKSDGSYNTLLSSGWNVKYSALELVWGDIYETLRDIKEQVNKDEVSPILFLMKWRLMDIQTLSSYTGFWRWTIKRHFKPNVYKKLSDKILLRYANSFQISLEELKNININDFHF